jgi:hypothetical protein
MHQMPKSDMYLHRKGFLGPGKRVCTIQMLSMANLRALRNM